MFTTCNGIFVLLPLPQIVFHAEAKMAPFKQCSKGLPIYLRPNSDLPTSADGSFHEAPPAASPSSALSPWVPQSILFPSCFTAGELAVHEDVLLQRLCVWFSLNCLPASSQLSPVQRGIPWPRPTPSKIAIHSHASSSYPSFLPSISALAIRKF